jgi:hypothetical protein
MFGVFVSELKVTNDAGDTVLSGRGVWLGKAASCGYVKRECKG